MMAHPRHRKKRDEGDPEAKVIDPGEVSVELSSVVDSKTEDKSRLQAHSGEEKKTAPEKLPIVSYVFPRDNKKTTSIQFHQDQAHKGYSYFFNENYPGYSPHQSGNHWGKWVIKYPKGSDELNQMSYQLIESLKQNKFFHFKVSSPADEFDHQLICVYTLDYQDEKEVQSTYHALLQMGIPHENIVGYKRDIETVLDSTNRFPLDKRVDIYLYDSDARITENGSVIKAIDYISSREDLIKSPFTTDKKERLNDFWIFYHRHISNSDNQLSNMDIIKEWVAQYKSEHNGENPFYILSQQRYTGWGASIFNPATTNSIKLFKKLVGKENIAALQDLIKEPSNNTPSPSV